MTIATGWSGAIAGNSSGSASNGRETVRIWRDVLALHGPVVRLAPAALDKVAGYAWSVMQGEASSPARASAIAYACAMAVADELLPWGEALGQGTAAGRIGRAVSLIHARPSAPLEVAALARAAGYSKHHFSRLFAASEGAPPARYLARLRLEEAAAALRGKFPADQDDSPGPRLPGPELFRKGLRRHVRDDPATL